METKKTGSKSLYTNSITKRVIVQEAITEFSHHVILKSYKIKLLQKPTFVEHCLFANIWVLTDYTYSLLFTVVFSSLSMQIDKVF